MEKYTFNQCNISAFGLIISIIGGLLVLLSINLVFDTTMANIPIFLIALIWAASAGIFAIICDQLGI